MPVLVKQTTVKCGIKLRADWCMASLGNTESREADARMHRRICIHLATLSVSENLLRFISTSRQLPSTFPLVILPERGYDNPGWSPRKDRSRDVLFNIIGLIYVEPG